MTETKNAPIYKARAGKFDASVWENEDKDGKKTQSVTLRKSWTKDGKEWSEAKIQVFPREIPDAVIVLEDVLRQLRLKAE